MFHFSWVSFSRALHVANVFPLYYWIFWEECIASCVWTILLALNRPNVRRVRQHSCRFFLHNWEVLRICFTEESIICFLICLYLHMLILTIIYCENGILNYYRCSTNKSGCGSQAGPERTRWCGTTSAQPYYPFFLLDWSSLDCK